MNFRWGFLHFLILRFLLAAFSELNARQISDAVLHPRFYTPSQWERFPSNPWEFRSGGCYPRTILGFDFFSCGLSLMSGDQRNLASLCLSGWGVQCGAIVTNAVIQDDGKTHLDKTPTVFLCLFQREGTSWGQVWFALLLWMALRLAACRSFLFSVKCKIRLEYDWFLFVMALALDVNYYLRHGFPSRHRC